MTIITYHMYSDVVIIPEAVDTRRLLPSPTTHIGIKIVAWNCCKQISQEQNNIPL